MNSFRWLGISILVVGCFNPDDPGGGETGSSSGTETAPTSGSPSSATADASSDTTSPSTTNDASSSGSSGACAGDGRCVEPAPEGWDGPSARLSEFGATTPPCGDPLGQPVAAGHVDLGPSPAECECSCQDPIGASCSATGVTDYEEASCDTALGGGTMTTTCSSLGGGAPGFIIDVPQVDSGTCQPEIAESLPEPDRTNARTLCGPTDPAQSCVGDEGLCLPDSGDGTYCVSTTGDQPCPAGSAYSQRELIYTSVDDTRGCGQCSCEDATGTCTGTGRLYNSGDCSGGGTDFPANGVCQPTTSFDAGFLIVDEVDAVCAASGGEPLGTVVAADFITICCAAF